MVEPRLESSYPCLILVHYPLHLASGLRIPKVGVKETEHLGGDACLFPSLM